MLPYSTRGQYEDEGIMNLLAKHATIQVGDDTYLPGNHWDCGNFEKGVEDAAFIHIRMKMWRGKKLVRTPKLEVYADMVARGLIAE